MYKKFQEENVQNRSNHLGEKKYETKQALKAETTVEYFLQKSYTTAVAVLKKDIM
jgi:hypothetical protein